VATPRWDHPAIGKGSGKKGPPTKKAKRRRLARARANERIEAENNATRMRNSQPGHGRADDGTDVPAERRGSRVKDRW
jgi:hypothetical protein